LSGFGVVNTPFNTWSSRKRKVSERDYIVAENAYKQTAKMIQEKKVTLEKMFNQEELSDKREKRGSSSGGIFGKMASIFSGSEDSGMLQTETQLKEASILRNDQNLCRNCTSSN
jgi:hypothetical protein